MFGLAGPFGASSQVLEPTAWLSRREGKQLAWAFRARTLTLARKLRQRPFCFGVDKASSMGHEDTSLDRASKVQKV